MSLLGIDMNKKIFLSATLLILLMSCERPTEQPVQSLPAALSGRVYFALDKQSIPLSVFMVTVRLSRSGYPSMEKSIYANKDSAASVLIPSVAVGVWSIDVKARGSDSTVLYSGEAEVSVLENTVAQVNVTLNPVSIGVGSVQINIIWGEIQPMIFPKTYGGTGNEASMSIHPTADKGFIFGGITHSLGQSGDAWVVKTTATGVVTWSKNYGTAGEDRVNSILQTSDGGYLFAGYHLGQGEDSWIVKLDSLGTIQWQKDYGTSGDDAFLMIKELSDGSFLTCGYTYTSDYGVGNFYDGRVVKITPTGSVIWSKNFGGTGGDFTMNFIEIPQKGFYVSGYNGSVQGDIYDLWLMELDQSGERVWEKIYKTPYEERSAAGITKTSDGHLMLSGYRNTSVGRKGLIIKTDTAGNEVWTKEYPSVNGDILKAHQLSDNSVLLSGYSTVTNYGQQGMLLKVNSEGEMMWTKYYGGTGSDMFSEFKVIDALSVAIIGHTTSSGAGGQDLWLLKVSNNGVMQ